uniref:Uncharacterized protein n=1 Tax=Leersia perrieri TaxID=77586 RepID=A0A0D9VDN3_9ORYZ
MSAARLQATLILISILLPAFLFGFISANSVVDGKTDRTVLITSLEKQGGRRLITGELASRSLFPKPSFDPRHDPPLSYGHARRFGAKTP